MNSRCRTRPWLIKLADSIIKSLHISDAIIELTKLIKGVNIMSEQSPLNDYVEMSHQSNPKETR